MMQHGQSRPKVRLPSAAATTEMDVSRPFNLDAPLARAFHASGESRFRWFIDQQTREPILDYGLS